MRFAVDLPNFEAYADPRTFTELARAAEAAGWDGLLVWDDRNEVGPPRL